MLEDVILAHSKNRWPEFLYLLCVCVVSVCVCAIGSSSHISNYLSIFIEISSFFLMSTYSVNLPPPATFRQTDASTLTYWSGRRNASNLSILSCQAMQIGPCMNWNSHADGSVSLREVFVNEWIYGGIIKRMFSLPFLLISFNITQCFWNKNHIPP